MIEEIYKRQYVDISALKELVFDEAYDLIKLDVVIGKIAVFLSKAEYHIFKILLTHCYCYSYQYYYFNYSTSGNA